MTRERYRSIGALVGLAIGVLIMLAAGLGGVVFAAVFGAGGCVAGAIAAEKLHDWKNGKGSQ